MKFMKQVAFFLLGSIILLAACQRDIDVFVPDNNIVGQVINPNPVQASVSGRINDENDQPVAGAIVRAGTETATTDNEGWFRFDNISLDKYSSVVTVTKAGYFKGIRTFSAAEGSVNFIKIKLLPKTLIGSVQASAGGSVSMANGATIGLPANGVVMTSIGSQMYTGEVRVYAAVIDPTASDISEILPGSFQATDASNLRVLMKSYGMMGVQLETPAGELLQIADGKSASLKFMIPSTLQPSAPATIALWFLNENDGLWKQEGQATKSGDHYEGTVSHFSFWNCDVPASSIFLEMNIQSAGQPVQYTAVKITRLSSNMQSYGLTDSSGAVSGFVFANEVLLLEVVNDCGEIIHSQQIGPFTANTNLGTVSITIPAQFYLSISGNAVECDSSPVINGAARISWQGRLFITPIVNGSFSLDINRCGSAVGTVYIQLINYTTLQLSDSIQVSSSTGVVNMGTISVCNNNTQQFVSLTRNGSQDVFVVPGDSIVYYPAGPVNIAINAAHMQTGSSVYFSFNPNSPGQIGPGSTQNLIEFSASSTTGQSYPSGSILVNITEYGAVGEYVAGNFSGLLVTNGGVPEPFTCSFRVMRQF